MTTNQKEINIKRLVKDYSIETTPKVYDKIGKLKDIIINNYEKNYSVMVLFVLFSRNNECSNSLDFFF